MIEFTPTEQRIIDLLRDGVTHSKEELRTLVGDEFQNSQDMRNHIWKINKKIRPIGQEIVCIIGRAYSIGYRHIRFLVPANDGKR